MASQQRRFSTAGAMFFGAALLFGGGGVAHAVNTTIGGPGCLSCFGSVYTLNVQEVSSGGGNTTYNVTYSVNTSGYSGPGSGLDAVAFKISNYNDIVSPPTVSGTATFSTPAVLDGLSANGCGAGGTSGFICTSSSNVGGVAVPNGTYTFNFNNLVLTTGSLFTNVSDWSLKALYVDSTGKQAGLTSEGGSVPVPGTLLMFGLGFAMLLLWRHGFKRATSVLTVL